MKLAISNLAWDNDEQNLIFDLLKSNGINRIEGIFTKINEWDKLDEKAIKLHKSFLKRNNIQVQSFQSIFYKTEHSDINNNEGILNHFKNIISYSEILSVNVLIFGSPTLRKINNSDPDNINYIFKQIDDLLSKTSVKVCIEPNAKIYGGHFFYNVAEIVNFIKYNNLENIKTMIDTHNSLLEQLDPCDELNQFFNYIEHVHVSENKLQNIEKEHKHKEFSEELKKLRYNKIVTHEVIKNKYVHDSIKKFIKIYQ